MIQKLSTLFLILFSFQSFGQLDVVKFDIESKAGKLWHILINDSIEFEHSYLTKGTFSAKIVATTRNDTVDFLLYNSKDKEFEKEIDSYHRLASCALTKENYKTKIRNQDSFYLFLPFYPCWISGYSKSSKKLIKRVFKE